MSVVTKALQFDIGASKRGRVHIDDVAFVLSDFGNNVAYIVRHSSNPKLWSRVSSMSKTKVGLEELCHMVYDFTLAFIKLVSGMKRAMFLDNSWYRTLFSVSNRVPRLLGVWYHRVPGVPELSTVCVPYANINYHEMFRISFDDDVRPALLAFYEFMFLDRELTDYIEMLHKTFLVAIGLCVEKVFESETLLWDKVVLEEVLHEKEKE